VKEAFPETKTVFIIPPSYNDLSSRLEKRAQDTDEEVKRRLMEAKKRSIHRAEI
jgi:guanylate kinase